MKDSQEIEPNETDLNNETIKDETIKDETINDETINDETVNVETIKDETINDETINNETVNVENFNTTINDEFAENEMYSRVVEIPKEKPLGIFDRFVSILISPDKLARNLKDNSVMGAPLIVLGVLALIYGFIYPPYTVLSTSKMRDLVVGLGGQDVFSPAIEEMSAKLFSVRGSLSMFAGILFAAAVATVIIFLICKACKGKNTFKQVFSLNIHVSIIFMVCIIISQSISVALGSMTDFTTLSALLMPNGGFDSILYNFLTSISIPGIWSVFIVYFGVKHFNDFGNLKSIIISLSIFFMQVLFSTVMLTISYNFMATLAAKA